jgi:hypothetical protein
MAVASGTCWYTQRLNGEPQKTKNQLYYEKNRERILRVNREAYRAGRSAGMPSRRQDVVCVMLNAAKYRAKEEGVPFSLVHADIVIPATCPVLGIPLKRSEGKVSEGSPSLDKVIPALGYVRDNIVVVSNRANRIKNNASVDELERVAGFYRKWHDSRLAH